MSIFSLLVRADLPDVLEICTIAEISASVTGSRGGFAVALLNDAIASSTSSSIEVS
jgi:hypothetical protein